MMALLSMLALLNWDVIVFWCMVVASLLFLLMLLATIFFQEDHKSRLPKELQHQASLHNLLRQKLLPIKPALGWQLTSVSSNVRVWTKQLVLPEAVHIVYGTCAVVDAEAEEILAAVQNISKQQEWDPDIITLNQSSLPRVISALDEGHPVMMDAVHITSSFHQCPKPAASFRHTVRDLLARVLTLVSFATKHRHKGEVSIKNIVVNRVWKVERDQSCWMFSKYGTETNTCIPWCYILVQPLLESPGKSNVHYIMRPSLELSKTSEDIAVYMATCLAGLHQYIKHTQLKLPPLTYTTLQHVSDLLPNIVEGETLTAMQKMAVDKPRPNSTQGRKEERKMVGEQYEGKDMKSGMHIGTKSKPVWRGSSPAGKSKKGLALRSRRNRLRALGTVGSGAGVGGSMARDADDRETESSSSEDTGYSDWMSNKGSLERESKASGVVTAPDPRVLTSPDPGVVTSDPGVVTGMIDYMLHDEEPISLKDGAPEMQTLANHCIAELVAQSNQVAAINVNASVSQQKAQSGGWFFHSLAKEVVILQKNPVKGKYHCFLGKGLIRAPPEDVFKAVKNPRTRFIYDNMLKKMDIVKELDDKVQIVHAVHEVPQLLRKESRDFCILQASKIEGSSFLVAFTSVNLAECLPSEEITRGYVLPSGWMIEPVGADTNQYSMVTYIVQVSIGVKGVPTSFMHFLSRRVPLSVAYLRTFVEAENM